MFLFNKVMGYLNKPVTQVLGDVKNAALGLFATATATAITLSPNQAMAQADYSTITDAVDWSSVAEAVIAVFALIAVVYVAFKGGKLILKAIKGA